ncbi:Mobile element protein [Candidatus Enterovibrio altilux]|uniref:Mobile element protein n=1 Tax=Candidatus Enterovibrio altilux TaxID=1927128 RepID=A0A291B7R4_9GAMM|nr:Mobile element protein [Candidatus Enterovibrio luxaltus]
MNNLRYKITNRYHTKPANHERLRLFSDLAISTNFVVKCVFSMPLRSLQGFINAVFKFIQLLLSCPHYLFISKRAQMVNVMCKTKNKESI